MSWKDTDFVSIDQSLLKDFLLVCQPLGQLTFLNHSLSIFCKDFTKA